MREICVFSQFQEWIIAAETRFRERNVSQNRSVEREIGFLIEFNFKKRGKERGSRFFDSFNR
jgi:hypothetical protein